MLRSPRLATTTTICLTILIWIFPFRAVFAFPSDDGLNTPSPNPNETYAGLICSPFGVCERCPEDALQEPFCKPFGNRLLVHCVNATRPPPSPHESPPLDASSPNQPSAPNHEMPVHPLGETLAWESCGRIVQQERADFYEFVACNVLFAAIALFVLFTRSRRLHALHARQLAARIGIIRSATGVGERR